MSFNPDNITRPKGTRALAKKYRQPDSAKRRQLLSEHEAALAKLGVRPKEAPTKERFWR